MKLTQHFDINQTLGYSELHQHILLLNAVPETWTQIPISRMADFKSAAVPIEPTLQDDGFYWAWTSDPLINSQMLFQLS